MQSPSFVGEKPSHRHSKTVLKGNLEVDAKELFMVQQFLRQNYNDTETIINPKCLVDLKKKGDRDFYYDYIAGAHEGRFDNINKLPTPLTNMKHVPATYFKKDSNRQPLFLQSAKFPIDYRIESGYKSPDPCAIEAD